MSKKIIVSLAFCLAFFSVAFGQGQQTSARQITLQQAVQIALDNNFAIKQAVNNLEGQETDVLSAKLNFLPSLTASASGNRNQGFQFNNLTQELGEFTVRTINGSLNANQVIFAGMQNIYNLRRAENALSSREDLLARAKEDVIFNTASIFLAVLLDKQLLEIAEQNLESSQTQLDQIKAQVEVGSRPIVDQYNQESTVANNELQVIQRENTLNFDKIRLIRVLEIDPLIEYDFISPEIDETKLVEQSFQLGELLNQAYANRLDLRAQEKQITANKFNLRATEGTLLPTLSLNAQLSSNYNDQIREVTGQDPVSGDLITQGVAFNTQFFERNVNKFVGLNFSLPLFQRWNRMANIQNSKIQYKNSILTLENQRLQVLQEVRQAYNDYVSFSKQVESTEKAYVAAERALETEEERYRVGASTLIELTNANATYVTAASNRAQARYQFVFQEQLLNYFLGNISPELTIAAFQN